LLLSAQNAALTRSTACIARRRCPQITAYIREVHRRDESYLLVRLDLETIRMLQLEVTAEDVAEAIQMAPKVKLKVKVRCNLPWRGRGRQ